jgi:glucose-6-phosphate isomerase
MQLADEALEYIYQNALAPIPEVWTPLAELQAKHLLSRVRLQSLLPTLNMTRGQIAAEREIIDPKPDQPLVQAGFIDLPYRTLESHRRKAEASELGRVLSLAGRLREQVDRVVILGMGGSHLGARALFEALLPSYHNEMPVPSRMGRPRIYFEGNALDNDALQDLLDMLEIACVDPDLRDERWGVIAISKGGDALETAGALRVFRAEASRFYGSQSPRRRQLILPVTGTKSQLRDLCKADGYPDEDILTIPDNVCGRFSVFSPAGLLPAAVMGLDVRALLLGAVAMTKRFLEEPFERNPVLQFAAVNYLLSEEGQKPIRVLAVWSKKLEALGLWYDQLIAESLGKQGRGPTPITAVQTRDLLSRGQQLQEGVRDKMINNLLVKSSRAQPIPIGMADRNEDELNAISRKTYPDLAFASWQAASQAYRDVARPTADLILPALSEHSMGQLMQMLMLATVVEGRLMGINPYGEPGTKAYKQQMRTSLGLNKPPSNS